MAEAPVLSLEGLSLAFGGLQVLEEVSLDLAEGELLSLIGPNGAGKTSVLNCISGLYPPSAGVIRFDGRNIVGAPPHLLARRGIARTFQHAELFRHITVIQNLLVGRHNRFRGGLLRNALYLGLTAREEVRERERVEEIIEFMELERYRKAPAQALSFGLQKRVGLARALAMEPRLLLLDEPSAGLNREEKEDLARFILRIKHEMRVSMVWVEHDMQMVADLSDRIFVLNYGRHIVTGAPAEVLSDPRVIEVYLGSRAAVAGPPPTP